MKKSKKGRPVSLPGFDERFRAHFEPGFIEEIEGGMVALTETMNQLCGSRMLAVFVSALSATGAFMETQFPGMDQTPEGREFKRSVARMTQGILSNFRKARVR